ncbi:MAG TPA: preprotein translocase subunit SecG [Gemmatimonadota bacterium]|nr:preprotein translocase subunit SecG [Gemmatimonadota bacterium]
MFAFLIVLIALVAFFIIAIVLLQSGKGGGLAAEFGGASSSTDSIMGGRQAANVLTRASWISGGVFMALALVLAIQASQSTAPQSSILRQEFQAPSGGPTSVLQSEDQEPAPVLDEAGDPATGGETEPEGDE